MAVIDRIIRMGEGRQLRKLNRAVTLTNAFADVYAEMTDEERRAYADWYEDRQDEKLR